MTKKSTSCTWDDYFILYVGGGRRRKWMVEEGEGVEGGGERRGKERKGGKEGKKEGEENLS
jgi:hypothetical protein